MTAVNQTGFRKKYIHAYLFQIYDKNMISKIKLQLTIKQYSPRRDCRAN